MEWFVLKNGDVLGPYETNSVAQMFGSHADVLIWGIPQQEWLSFDDWARRMNLGAVVSGRQASASHQTQQVVEPQHVQEHHVQPAVQNIQSTPEPQFVQRVAPISESQVSAKASHSIERPLEVSHQEQPHVEARNNIYIPAEDAADVEPKHSVMNSGEVYVKEEYNPDMDATAVYVQPGAAEVVNEEGLEDDGRTVVSSVDLPLEIPNEDDIGDEIDNVVPLRSESVENAVSPETGADSIQDLLHQAKEQLNDEGHNEDVVSALSNQGLDDAGDLSDYLDEVTGEIPQVQDALDEDVQIPTIEELLAQDEQEEDLEIPTIEDLLADTDDDLSEEPLDIEQLLADQQNSSSEENDGIESSSHDNDDLDLSFDGKTQVYEESMSMDSLFDGNAQAEPAEEDEDLNLDFSGTSEVSEDATRVESLFDIDNKVSSAVEENKDNDLVWEGQGAEEEEATRIQMSESEQSSVDEDLEEEATRVQASSEDDSDLEEESTRVSTSSESQDDVYSLDGELDDEESTRVNSSSEDDDYLGSQLEEESTRVSASNSNDDAYDLESDLEDEATRVSASDEELDLNDLENLDDLEAVEDEVFESFSIEDDEEESTRVSASSNEDANGSEEYDEGATRVSVNSQEDDSAYDLDEEEGATSVSVSQSDNQEDEALGVEVEADEEEATRVSASETSVEEDLSEFEEEVTQDGLDHFINKMKNAAEEAANPQSEEEESDEDYGISDATQVDELRNIAKQIQQDKLMQEDFIWYVAYEGESEGPLTLSQVLKNLDDYEVKDFVYLWREGFIDWKNLFDVPELSSGLGIGFRRHSRVQATGTVSVEFEGGVQIGQLDNLSESGIGLTGIDSLRLGDIVKVKVDADDLDDVFMVVARVRFVSETGLLGLSYEKDKYQENIAKIIEFVKSKAEKIAA